LALPTPTRDWVSLAVDLLPYRGIMFMSYSPEPTYPSVPVTDLVGVATFRAHEM